MRYAALFTTYAWDAFVARQYARIRSKVHTGDLYVMADETRGPLLGMPDTNVIRTNQQEILNHGGRKPFVEKGDWGRKAALWWNLDYLTYRFFDDHQQYDYCVTMDFDACINLNVDDLVERVAAEGFDFVALPVPEPMPDWYWRRAHSPVYSMEEINAHLLCVIIISKAASNYLSRRRREMVSEYEAGTLKFWPFCEAFMSTELQKGGFRIGNLAAFGSIQNYGWSPVMLEDDFAVGLPEGFIHPLLDKKRFIPAFMLRYTPAIDWAKPFGPLWSTLRRFHFNEYAPYLMTSTWSRLVRRSKRAVRRLKRRFA